MSSRCVRVLGVLGLLVFVACGSWADGELTGSVASPSPARTELTGTSTPDPQASPLRSGGAVEPSSPDGLPTAAPPTAEPSPGPSVFIPPAGRYVYATSGTWQSGQQQGDVPSRQIADVSVEPKESFTQVRAVSRFEGESSRQTLVVGATESEARLRSLGSSSGDGGLLASDLAVTPDPPALIAKLPYVVGDEWEIAWQDRQLGVQAVGTGKVLRRESVDTGIGPLDTVVIEVRQRLAGAASGELTITLWIDPATGVQAQQHTISQTEGLGGASRSDVLATLQEGPA